MKQTVAGKEISIYDKHCLSLSKEEIEANLAAGKPYVIRQITREQAQPLLKMRSMVTLP